MTYIRILATLTILLMPVGPDRMHVDLPCFDSMPVAPVNSLKPGAEMDIDYQLWLIERSYDHDING